MVDPSRRVSAAGEPQTYLDTQGRLILAPVEPVSWSADELLGFEFEADGELALGVSVVSHGRKFFRHYPRSSAGSHVLMFLSPPGFDGGQDISDIEQVIVYFYTDKQERVIRVQPKRLLLFHDRQQLSEYFTQVGPTFRTN